MTPLHNDHNVYILGAGFSRDAGLPLMHDFLDHMRSALDVIDDAEHPGAREAIAMVLEFRREAASAAHRAAFNPDNVEELFSLASATANEDLTRLFTHAIAVTIEIASKPGPRQDLGFRVVMDPSDLAHPATGAWPEVDATATFTPPKPKKVFECADVYDHYAGVLSGAFCACRPKAMNTVITFNYDTLLETALQRLGFTVNMGFTNISPPAAAVGTPSTMPVLKLHGSINVAAEPGNSYLQASSYSNLLANGRNPYIVPPTWSKTFANPLTRTWAQALDALETATRVIIIGFSIPQTDQHFKYLLAAGLRRNISSGSPLDAC